jgi:Ca-activated chloride channel family protein
MGAAMRRVRVAACLVACVGLGIVACARQTPVFRTGVELVRVDVLVTDGGRPVAGLTADDFEVLDNGVPQRVRLATTAGDVSVALVLDTSGSVEGDKLRDLVRASQALLGALHPADRASLVTFSDRVALPAGESRDPAAVSEALLQAHASGSTAMWDGLFAGVAMVGRDVGRSLVLLFTDGLDNASWLTGEQTTECLKRSEAVVYVVAALRSAGNAAQVPRGAMVKAQARMNAIAFQTGGAVFAAESSAGLTQQFVGVLEEFRLRYLLMYEPAGVRRDDGWHRLKVSVKKRAGQVQARPGYYATPPPKRGRE